MVSTSDKCPLSLEELVQAIEVELSSNNGVALSQQERLKDLLIRYDADHDDLAPFSMVDPSKNYTRNLIATDNKTFTLILLCWTPLKESPIHDHPCDGCWFRVVDGDIRETHYVKSSDGVSLEQTKELNYSEGLVSFITDSIALHKVGNPTTKPARSLHLYAPPFDSCKVWLNEANANESREAHISYYSEGGEVVDYRGR